MMKTNALLQTCSLLSFLLCFGACSTEKEEDLSPELPADRYFPPINGSSWEALPPTFTDGCESELNDLQSFLEGANTKAFIVLKNGRIVTEWYFDSFTADSNWYWASAGKSLTAVNVGIAQQEGLLSISDRTSEHLGEGWTSLSAENESLITVEHQLSMSTGLDEGVDNSNCTDPECLQFLAAGGLTIMHLIHF